MSASDKFIALRQSGFTSPIDHNGDAVMSRTDKNGKPLPMFKGGDGTGTQDDDRSPRAGRLARSRGSR
jgi:hypothetical protein